MASSIIRQGAEALRRANSQLARIRVEKKEDLEEGLAGLTGAVTAAGAAIIDKKWGENGEALKIKGVVPVNAAAGGLLAATALVWRKMPGRRIVGGAGLGALYAGIYKGVYDAVEFEQ